MRHGIIHHVAGNVAALADIERQFAALGAESRICLGSAVGLYPFVDQTVEFLRHYNYVVLRNSTDDGFINGGPYDGWSCTYLVEAFQYARPRTSESTIAFLRAAPTAVVSHGWRFISRFPTFGGFLSREEESQAAFRSCTEQIVFHGSDRELRICHESGRTERPGPGKHQIDSNERQLISPGGIGGRYMGSEPPSAILFDEETMSIEVLRPKLDTGAMLSSLAGSGYPRDVLQYIERNEFRC